MAVNFRNQKENGILIKPFYGSSKKDMALYYLDEILTSETFLNFDDVRFGIKKFKNDIINKVTSTLGWNI